MSPNGDRVAIPMVAILLATILSIAAVAPGLAGGTATAGDLSIGVTQDGSDVTATVAHDGTAVENATVVVSAQNNSSYAGAGAYTTDANGTVSLSAPDANVTVEVIARMDAATGSTTVELLAVEEETPEFDTLGERVSWFVHSLLGGEDSEGGIGQAISEFVRSYDPSNDDEFDHEGKLDHAGPLDQAGTAANESSGGPSEHANDDSNETSGQ